MKNIAQQKIIEQFKFFLTSFDSWSLLGSNATTITEFYRFKCHLIDKCARLAVLDDAENFCTDTVLLLVFISEKFQKFAQSTLAILYTDNLTLLLMSLEATLFNKLSANFWSAFKLLPTTAWQQLAKKWLDSLPVTENAALKLGVEKKMRSIYSYLPIQLIMRIETILSGINLSDAPTEEDNEIAHESDGDRQLLPTFFYRTERKDNATVINNSALIPINEQADQPNPVRLTCTERLFAFK